MDDTITVTITVTNVDEAGTVTLSSTQPIEGIPLAATLDDPDEVSGSVTWSWESSPNRSSSWTPISGATTDTYGPVAADVGNATCGPLPPTTMWRARAKAPGQSQSIPCGR